MSTSAPLHRGSVSAHDAPHSSVFPSGAPQAPIPATEQPWLYACPSCCAQAVGEHVGLMMDQPLRKQHRPGCQGAYKVLIGQLPLRAAKLRQVASAAQDQQQLLAMLAAGQVAAAQHLNEALQLLLLAEPAPVRETGMLDSIVRQVRAALNLIVTGDELTVHASTPAPMHARPAAQYAVPDLFNSEACANCGQPLRDHPIEIGTKNGPRLVCIVVKDAAQLTLVDWSGIPESERQKVRPARCDRCDPFGRPDENCTVCNGTGLIPDAFEKDDTHG